MSHETQTTRLLRQRLEAVYAGHATANGENGTYLLGCGMLAIAEQLAYLGYLIDRNDVEVIQDVADNFVSTLRTVSDAGGALVRCPSCGHRWREHGANGCAADDEAAMSGCDCPQPPPPSSGYGHRADPGGAAPGGES